MDEEIELTAQQQYDLNCPVLLRLDDLNKSVYEDEENLVVIFVLAPTLCTFSNKIETTVIREATQPMKATEHAKFFRIHLERCDVSIIDRLGGLSQTPSTLFFLKGQQVATFVGSNTDKIVGSIRNEMVKRNEEMREYDEAKEEAERLAREEQEEHEEEPEGEEDNE
eukprot:GILI01007092.1.p1 GENE.GILI01007092.1~~GILI01007092.1.p1  ORF type:complete len:167 (-),score=31.60 GILI01007092.1:89-589(-)